MPELLNRSPDEVLAAMGASFGTTWPNPWWPSGNSAYDDCAACLSYYLFGLNSFGNPYYTYVSQIQNWGRDRGVWHPGSDGVQPGDVLAFDWDGDGDPDHTEIVVAVSPGGSTVTSRGTNSNPGDDLRDRTRSAGYILSYIRPPYLQGDEFDMASLDDLRQIVDDAVRNATATRTSAVRREGRGRLYYCATPPPGLPHFIVIFWDRTSNNILYANADADGGERQARNWSELYYQTADTVEQAKASPIEPDRFRKLIDFALGKDSAFVNQLALHT
ncbi:CHAP domain-containing protein [Leifsonia xyli]|uniref:CHAP domain-containing protein n=1 Tax=Leifsonia xyli TaxID=1575 RepID=UPI003D66EC6E